MKAVIVSGSPRKNWNTEKALKKAEEGLASEGIESEFIRLYDYEYKGCISCFSCKRINAKTNGLCAYKDALHPILEKAHTADIIIAGSPVYFSDATGQFRSFLERLFFPVYSYFIKEDGQTKVYRDKVIPTGLIYTMNCPTEWLEKYNYPILFSTSAKMMEMVMGYNELLYICNTYQFTDYSKYEINLFSEEEKRKYRDEHFTIDMENAFNLGKNLAKKAKEIQ